MILHLVSDEKVVHRTVKMFNEYDPDNNFFLCVSKKKNYVHIKPEDNVASSNNEDIDRIDFSKFDTVIIHYLNNSKIKFIYKHHLQRCAIIWIVWGSDLYSLLYKRGRYELYSEENSYPKLKLNFKNNAIYNTFKKCKTLAIYLSMIGTRFYSFYTDCYRSKFYHNCLNYITSGSHTLKLIENGKELKNYKGKLDFCYYPIEMTLGNLTGKWCKGKNIMIGNSAQATNNHEYILRFLKEVDFSNHTIIVPLSYGGDEEYVEIVTQKYLMLPNAKVLHNFIPLHDYNALLLTSSTCIYAHFRGEAWGNILISLYLGSKVYLSRKSPLLNKCREMNFKVFELEDISKTFEIELTQEEKQQNRNIALSNYSEKKCAEYIKKIGHIGKG